MMDATTKAVIETVGDAGYRVDIAVGGGGRCVVEAVCLADGERFIIRAPDLYEVAVELAEQVGIELEDG